MKKKRLAKKLCFVLFQNRFELNNNTLEQCGTKLEQFWNNFENYNF